MLDKLSETIVSRLKHAGVIDESIEDIYVYGIHVILSNTIGIVAALVVGLAFSRFYEACIFLLSFVITRSFTGGYHAKTTILCFLVTICVMCLAMMSSFITIFPISFCLIVGIASVFMATRFAPIENENKEMTIELKNRGRLVSIALILIQNTIWMVLRCLNCGLYRMIVISLFFIIISMAISIVTERRKNYEKDNV